MILSENGSSDVEPVTSRKIAHGEAGCIREAP